MLHARTIIAIYPLGFSGFIRTTIHCHHSTSTLIAQPFLLKAHYGVINVPMHKHFMIRTCLVPSLSIDVSFQGQFAIAIIVTRRQAHQRHASESGDNERDIRDILRIVKIDVRSHSPHRTTTAAVDLLYSEIKKKCRRFSHHSLCGMSSPAQLSPAQPARSSSRTRRNSCSTTLTSTDCSNTHLTSREYLLPSDYLRSLCSAHDETRTRIYCRTGSKHSSEA